MCDDRTSLHPTSRDGISTISERYEATSHLLFRHSTPFMIAAFPPKGCRPSSPTTSTLRDHSTSQQQQQQFPRSNTIPHYIQTVRLGTDQLFHLAYNDAPISVVQEFFDLVVNARYQLLSALQTNPVSTPLQKEGLTVLTSTENIVTDVIQLYPELTIPELELIKDLDSAFTDDFWCDEDDDDHDSNSISGCPTSDGASATSESDFENESEVSSTIGSDYHSEYESKSEFEANFQCSSAICSESDASCPNEDDSVDCQEHECSESPTGDVDNYGSAQNNSSLVHSIVTVDSETDTKPLQSPVALPTSPTTPRLPPTFSLLKSSLRTLTRPVFKSYLLRSVPHPPIGPTPQMDSAARPPPWPPPSDKSS